MSAIADLKLPRFGGLTKYDAPMLRAVAEALRPPSRERPSDWAAKNVFLTPEMTERPGRYNPDLFPFTRGIMDAEHDNPAKVGVIVKKPAQCGVSTAMLIEMAAATMNVRGGILYAIAARDDVAEFVGKYFQPLINNAPAIKNRFDRAAEAGRRSVTLSRAFVGGNVMFVGAGSPGKVSTFPYGRIYIDEYEQCQANFPAQFGDVFGFAQGRQKFIRGRRWIAVWSHPLRRGEGTDKLFTTVSTEHRFVFTCPHTHADGQPCGHAVFPLWANVAYTRAQPDGTPDPESAELRCPACQKPISDAQRSRALWDTGRFESELTGEQQSRRAFVGRWVHGLCNPYQSVVGLARKFSACSSDEELTTFYNLECGEEYAAGRQTITVETVRQRFQEAAKIVLPGGPRGVRYLVVGADAQYPEQNPTLFSVAVAYAVTGMAYLCAVEAISGFAAWFEWLRTLEFDLDQPPGFVGPRKLGVRLAVCDCKWNTGLILDNIRFAPALYSPASNARIDLLPVQYEAHLKRDNPVVEVPLAKQIHPLHPNLPPLRRYQLNRYTFVDRTMRRWSEGRVTVLCKPPAELAAHVTANVLRPKRTLHGWETEELDWEKIPKARDDWARGMDYAEAGAAIELGLDRMHQEIPSETEGVGQGAVERSGRGYFGHSRGGGGGYWRHGE